MQNSACAYDYNEFNDDCGPPSKRSCVEKLLMILLLLLLLSRSVRFCYTDAR